MSSAAGGGTLDLAEMDEVLRAEGVHALLDRWDRLLADAAPDDGRQAIRAALRLAAPTLEVDPGQLPGQLLARLSADSGVIVAELIEQVRRWDREPWLQPLTRSPAPAGSPLIASLPGHPDDVTALAITPDGRRAVSGSAPRTVKVWDLERCAELHTLRGGGRYGPGEGYGLDVNALAVSEDGQRVGSVNGDGRIHVWDLRDDGRLRSAGGLAGDDEDWIGTITIDGNRAACAFQSSIIGSVETAQRGLIELFDLDLGEVIQSWRDPYGTGEALALTSDGSTLVESGGSLRMWDLGAESVTALGGPGAVPGALAVTPDAHRIVAGHHDGTITVRDVESSGLGETLTGHTGPVNAVAVTPDGGRALSGSSDATVRLWDLDTRTELCRLSGHAGGVRAVAMTPDGRHAVSGGVDRLVRVWDLGVAVDGSAQPQHLAVRGVALSADGRRAVVRSIDGTAEVWDLGEGEGSSDRSDDTVTDAAPVPDATRERMEALERAEAENADGHELQVLAVSPDGKRAVCASRAWTVVSGRHRWSVDHRTVRVWDLGPEPAGRTLAERSENVVGFQQAQWFSAVALSADGQFAVGVSEDRAITLWDLDTASTLASFTADSALDVCGISGDGQTVAAAGSTGHVYVLRLVAGPGL